MAEKPFQIKDFEELSEDARRLISEALQLGTMTLESNGVPQRVVTLEGKVLADLVKWLATHRDKRPKLVNTPEDFQIKKTKGGGDAK